MYTIMENHAKPKNAVRRKRKLPLETKSEPKNNIKLPDTEKTQKIKVPRKKSAVEKISPLDTKIKDKHSSPIRTPSPTKSATVKKQKAQYPIFENKELIGQFMKVPMNNNQKGRIRQALKIQLQGSNECLFPDVINGKIQSVVNKSKPLNESDLRKVRILYNMLLTSVEKNVNIELAKPKKKKKKQLQNSKQEVNKELPKIEEELSSAEKELHRIEKQSPKVEKELHKIKKESPKVEKELPKVEKKLPKVKKELPEGVKELPKVKGAKRYVVFMGNLPSDVTKNRIMGHFSELNEHIKDIRIQKPAPGKKTAFAYVELSNEPSYELALSKHHSMMGNKRINVLYTTHKKSKMSKAQVKSKSAKLIALQKTGKLIGSVPVSKKRSHRRMIMKKARAKEAAALNKN